jgi:hypothetical protein
MQKRIRLPRDTRAVERKRSGSLSSPHITVVSRHFESKCTLANIRNSFIQQVIISWASSMSNSSLKSVVLSMIVPALSEVNHTSQILSYFSIIYWAQAHPYRMLKTERENIKFGFVP